MDLVLFGARLSHTLFATVAPESLHAVPLASLAVMRSQLPDVFASTEVLYYLRELVVQLRRHPAFRAGLATETFAAFETAARFALSSLPSPFTPLCTSHTHRCGQDCGARGRVHVRLAGARAERRGHGRAPQSRARGRTQRRERACRRPLAHPRPRLKIRIL